MPLIPDHLLTLAAIARTGSLTQAAISLGKTQPAISTQIKQLSAYIGEPVVHRHRHGVTLTPGGEALLPTAQEAARALDNAEHIIKRLKGNEVSQLRIASATSIAVYLMPPVLALYRNRFPKIAVRLDICNATEAVDRLAQNDADLALVRGPVTHLAKTVASQTLIDDETVLAVRADHPFAKRQRIQIADLSGLDIVRQGSSSTTQTMVDRLAEGHALEFGTTFVAPGVDAVKEAILQGLGAGFLSRFAISRECAIGSLKAISISGGDLKRPVTLLYPRTPQLSPRAHAFLDIVQEAHLGAPTYSRR